MDTNHMAPRPKFLLELLRQLGCGIARGVGHLIVLMLAGE